MYMDDTGVAGTDGTNAGFRVDEVRRETGLPPSSSTASASPKRTGKGVGKGDTGTLRGISPLTHCPRRVQPIAAPSRKQNAIRATSRNPETSYILFALQCTPVPARYHRAEMVIVHVHAQVKPEFRRGLQCGHGRERAQQRARAGVLRFDVIQQEDDPTRFVLIEIYRTVEATVAHKETAHYAAWQAVAAPMMAGPRSRVKYSTVFPPSRIGRMRFEFATATRIVFGEGVLAEVRRPRGRWGAGSARHRPITPAHAAPRGGDIRGRGRAYVDVVRRGVEAAREAGPTWSSRSAAAGAIDAGKAIAALVANGGDVLDYLEVIGKAQPLARPSVPFIAIPTTAGTGSR